MTASIFDPAAFPAPMPAARARMPQRRGHEGFNLEHDGIAYHLGVGRYPDGTVGELFLSTVKASSALNALARDVAITLSVGLQSGVPLAHYRKAVQRQPDGSSASLLGTVLDCIVEAFP
ncbi:hypothetical protein [Lichenihabitans psoromatis]|uniref:hypothetical protein n=1 Tax=Lichenihabitans psoromatis TaxID=2528642 RepID=UPI0010383290|nr:hypothetical protein [Lichenihabitans psoromatis]